MAVCVGAGVIATVEGDGGATAIASLRYTQRCTAFGEYCLDLHVGRAHDKGVLGILGDQLERAV